MDCINVHAVDNRSLLGVLSRHKYRLYACFTGKHDHGKNSVYAADITVEGYLSDERTAVGVLGYHSHTAEYSHKYRHVVNRAALFRVCGSKIYHDRSHRKADAA